MSKRSAEKGATDGAATKKACMGTAGDTQTEPAQAEEEETSNNVFSHDLDTLQCDICFMPFESQIYSSMQERARGVRQLLRQAGPQVPQLQALHRQLPVPHHGEDPRRDDQALQVQEGWLQEHPQVLRDPNPRGRDLLVRALPMPVRRLHLLRQAPPRPHAGPDRSWSPLDFSGPVTLTLDKSRPFRVILQNILGGKSVFLLLNGGDVPTGRSLSVVRIYPRPAPADEDGGAQVAQQYTVAMKGNQPGSTFSLTASGSVPFVRRIEGYKAHELLFVPDACWGSSQTVVVTVAVKL
ncbi:uncharacterized protein LOC100831323 isoform X1 [Brachypodium distachyon]|uniref:Uncharacterized protein n=1 Tax=Brachypodium distachyon TaxID=15368 RepID=A0A2K2D6R7_BRADI|nr:uncharacterized protein LOC100831323 isoform X1 [Brachypodium distachyon]PNT69966.1 hypothetical protein BRADI_2g03868v3 [Brachypodium distachyon]|eukprot:XP_014755006.1 uncharacterized protein LOC100831323 isoform X1 [Brachypodium distachyon]